MASEIDPAAESLTKSVVARHDLAAGTVLGEEHLTIKKPGAGIPGARFANCSGLAAAKPQFDEMLRETD